MPVLWFEQHVVATEDVTNIVKFILAAPLAGQLLGVIFFTIGTIFLLVSCLSKDYEIQAQPTNISKTESQKYLPESLPLVKTNLLKIQ